MPQTDAVAKKQMEKLPAHHLLFYDPAAEDSLAAAAAFRAVAKK